MIAGFFKQSKPIVHIFMGFVLGVYFFIEVFKNTAINYDGSFLVLTLVKYIFLLIAYIFFNYLTSYFEIVKYHSFSSVIFVLLSSLLMPEIVDSLMIFGFVILGLGFWRLLHIVKSENPISCIFDSTFLIILASLFYQPFVFLLLLILIATIIFLPPRWKYFFAPIFSVSAFVILVQMYSLFRYDKVVGFRFFRPEFGFNADFYLDKVTDIMLLVWLVPATLCIYQIIQVKRKRALYHKEIATFFLVFLVLSFIIYMLSGKSITELWVLSLWPLSIYLGDYLSRILSKLKLELLFWTFVIFSIVFTI